MTGSKAPNRLDTTSDQLVASFLGGLSRNGNDTHEHLVIAAEFLQLVNVVHRLAIIGLLQLGRTVESRQNIQTILLETLVAHQRQTQFTGADQNSIGGIVIAQKLFNILDQALTEVTDLGSTAGRNHGQILTNLNLAHAKGVCKGCCRNIRSCAILDALQISKISGKALKHSLGNFFAFHISLLVNIDIFLYRL